MRRLRLLGAPARIALARLRSRPVAVVALVVALAGAGGLIGWSSLTAALSQEDNVHRVLSGLSPRERSLRVLYFTLPRQEDFRAARLERSFRSFGSVLGEPRSVRVWHSIEPNNPLGTRLVVAGDPKRDVVLSAGRLPTGCSGDACEVVELTGEKRLGRRITLGNGQSAVVVGTGSLRPEVLAGTSQLGRQALLLRSIPPALRPLVLEHGSTVVRSAALVPARVHAFALASLADRLRAFVVRLERGDRLVHASAPIGTLENLDRRGRVARERLLVVSGEAAALVLAFAAFIATARRREAEVEAEQLASFGASRAQAWTARALESLVPSLAALVLALGGVWLAATAVGSARGFPGGFVGAALSPETLAAIAAAGAAAFLLLVVTAAPRRLALGRGALELAALAALGVLVWQASTTGALDPARIATGGAGPVVLVVPALAFFVAAVFLLRVLPWALRLGERGTRSAPVGIRLALLTAARRPAQAAAVTTFLAVALGCSLFSLAYRATLEHQAREQARFAVGATWRVAERGRRRQPDVTPVTRYTRVSRERPELAMRTTGSVPAAFPRGSELQVNVLALPAARLPELLGWSNGFSNLSRPELARRIRPSPVRLVGRRIAPDARAIRVWARAEADYPRLVVLHLLLRGQDFAHVTLGAAWKRWALMRFSLPPRLRDSRVVGVEFVPTRVPLHYLYEPHGFVDLGPLEERTSKGWSPLRSLGDWVSVTTPDGRSGIVVSRTFRRAPVECGVRYALNGTFEPLMHPKIGLPAAVPGFESGPVRALASPSVVAQAVDGMVTLNVLGKRIPVRIAARSTLFPTVVSDRSSFLVFDYDTLFAALNAIQPGVAVPGEAWFFGRPPPSAARVQEPPFRAAQVFDVGRSERRLLGDPLAAGTRSVLGVTAIVAALLGLLGLLLMVRSALQSDRLLLAEYEALGVRPVSLRRSSQLRLVALSVLGVAAGVAGALLSVRLVGAYVAVTAAGGEPLPPISTVVDWPLAAAVIASLGVSGALLAAVLSARALGESPARRLRA